MLLLEKSLLVHGSQSIYVTAISTAFTLLLEPFRWEGIFIPLLPDIAYDVLGSPVPIIVGILNDEGKRFQRHIEEDSPIAILDLDEYLNDFVSTQALIYTDLTR